MRQLRQLTLTVYVWQRKPYWLRCQGKTRRFTRISEARQWAEAEGREIRVKIRA